MALILSVSTYLEARTLSPTFSIRYEPARNIPITDPIPVAIGIKEFQRNYLIKCFNSHRSCIHPDASANVTRNTFHPLETTTLGKASDVEPVSRPTLTEMLVLKGAIDKL